MTDNTELLPCPFERGQVWENPDDKMPEYVTVWRNGRLFCRDENTAKEPIHAKSLILKYIRSDLHDRRVTELLEANNRLVEENRKLKNAAQEKWQPIETAPKAQRVLVWSGEEQYCAHWAKNPFTNDEAWIVAEWGDDGDQALVKPTHWMPLPEPPK